MKNSSAPKVFLKFFRWYCHPKLQKHIEGDLMELYHERIKEFGKRKADRKFIIDVLLLFRPGIIKPREGYKNLNTYGMYKSYFKIGWRNLLRSKGYSLINIGGLALGMAVALLIGLWVYDELNFNKYHNHYDRLARVMQNQTYNGEVNSQITVPSTMAQELRNSYGSDFKYVVQASWEGSYLFSIGEKQFLESGQFFEPQITNMLGLEIISGVASGLEEPNSIMLSESVASAMFGSPDQALNKTIRFINKHDLNVTGVYKDLPYTSSFKDLGVLMPWELFLIANPWVKEMSDPWGSSFSQTFVMLNENGEVNQISQKIKNAKLNKVSDEEKKFKGELFLHPMSKWHLYSDFKNGSNAGGRIEFVWLFGIIGSFVLLLACINFMNLSTARSEKRAKEVGIRKAIGSVRWQLINQFFSESLLVVLLAFLLSIVFVSLALPVFNRIADKNITILWTSPMFWIVGIGISLITGLVAGSYPALYLSSFQSVKTLKGTFRAGRFAAVPRKVLVVLQFTVSVTLIIGTMVVYQQIDYAKSRPIGYNRDGLIRIPLEDEVYQHFEAIRYELKSSGTIEEMTIATSPLTDVWQTNGGFDWEGKDPNLSVDFPNNGVSHEFGKTVGWTIKEGRDFSRSFSTDTSAMILNESAARFMGIKDPVGKILKWNDRPYTIIGIVKDVLQESPYQPVRPSVFHIARGQQNILIVRLDRTKNARETLASMEKEFKKYSPGIPFLYNFVDEEYAQKFGNEERIGTLASIFAVFAIVISCLGLFGLASFVAEQRTKEIGIRKVVGASLFSLWKLLSKDFAVLVMISCVIAVPLSYTYMTGWLQKYDYHTEISWYVFVITFLSAMIITLITVSFQAIKAALKNPVNCLRTE